MIYVIRGIFLALVSIVALAYTLVTLNSVETSRNFVVYYVMIAAVVAAFTVFLLDVVVKKKNLSTMSGVLFGILVGVMISLCIGFLVDQVVDVFILQPVSAPTAVVVPADQGADGSSSSSPVVVVTPAPRHRRRLPRREGLVIRRCIGRRAVRGRYRRMRRRCSMIRF